MSYYTVKKLHEGIYSIHEPANVFSYLIVGKEKALLYDTGFGFGDLAATVKEITPLPIEVVLSHGHYDHVCGAAQFEFAHIHIAEFELAQRHASRTARANAIEKNADKLPENFDKEKYLNAGTGDIRRMWPRRSFELGGLTVDVVPMEGHTFGSVGLLVREAAVLFAGDAFGSHLWLFLEESLPIPQYVDMLDRVKELPFNTFYLGHSNEPLPKSEIDKYKAVALDASVDKAAPYPQLPELGGMFHEKDGVGIVFNPIKVKRYWKKNKPIKSIHLNQLGYRPNDPKTAVIAEVDAQEFTLVRVADGSVAYTGKCSEPEFNPPSDENVRVADFSSFNEPGEYELHAGGVKSFPFKVGEGVYHGLRKALLDFFHYQKCGVDLDCGVWSHPACHTGLATVYGTDEKKEVSGGWHDAGDYGRYIVPAAVAVADLLLAHERTATPDENLLDETWFEIEWMLKLQDEKTGGVYHKVSCYQFNALDEMPHDEHGELVLSPISATATADFAASMALAARFYPEKRDELIAAAKKAWAWCVANPDVPGFMNPEGVRTGGYGDRSDRDERFWAACELYSATGEEIYHDYIKEYVKQGEIDTGLGWGDVGMFGVLAYLQAKNLDAALEARFKAILLDECTKKMEAFKTEPYGVSLGMNYRWGSNMDVGNNAQLLLFGAEYTSNEADAAAFKAAALEHMHYLLGRNPVSYSYVTGFGANAYKYPHHRPSVAKGQAVPGMVAGGANMMTMQDPALRDTCTGCAPAHCYVDDKNSFSANEITIYWNSPVYFAATVLGI
jgi:endoglucanase